MQKGEFFVTGEVFLLDIGLLMGAIRVSCKSKLTFMATAEDRASI